MTNVTIAPDQDTEITGNWLPNTGATFYAVLDEASANDSDFILSGASPNQDRIKIRLSDPASAMTDPMTVAVRCKASTGTINLAIRLVENTTTIAEWLEEGIATTWTTVTHELTAPERASISDFTDLYIELEANPSTSFTGLLDSYPGAALAYSFRKLKGDYAGSAVRIRESGGNTEQDIGFTAGGDFDTATAASFIGANTGYIVKWYDQSGSGADVVQATAANQPLYVASAINSKPSCDFTSASSHYLKSADGGLAHVYSVNEAGSAFLVGSLDNAGAAYSGIFSIRDSGLTTQEDWNTNAAWALTRSVSAEAIDCTISSTNCAGAAKAVTYGTAFQTSIILTTAATNNANHWMNGATTGAVTACATGWIPGYFGNALTVFVRARAGGSGVPGNYGDGRNAEILFYISDQTSNRAAIEADQKAYWGTP